jgi:hypothetical protein
MIRSVRLLSGLLVGLWGMTACGDPEDPGEEEISSESSAVEGCSGTGFSVFQQLCAVGESGGKPAVNFRGQWFALDYNGGNWIVLNGVGAQASAVAPVDTATDDTRAQCRAECPPNCPGHGRPCDPEARQLCIQTCMTSPYTLEEHRKFVWSVAGRTYELEGTQITENQRTVGGQQDVKIGRNLHLVVTTSDPIDGNAWTVVAHPVRAKAGASDQVQANWEATEPGASTTMGLYNGLFPESQINVSFTSNVELMSAVKTSSPGTPEMLARSNTAMNRALDAVLPQGSSFQSHFEPEALQIAGSVLGRVPGAGGGGSYDLQRFSQFYMNDRRGHVGFSAAGSGDRPMAQSTRRDWRFRHTILDYELTFPFLAGICGFVVDVNSYIAGALTLGQKSCFDGVPVDIDMAGNLEFALKAAGGFGCNIVLASASAGLGGGVRAAAEFASSVDAASVPPALTASLNIYSDVNYAAHFKVRVLFWTKKWEKLLGQRRIFQKSASYRLGAHHEQEQAQLCALGGTPAETGTCLDPEASCDVEGRCIRYGFTASGEAQRTDVGECQLPQCETIPELPLAEQFDTFAAPAPACLPQCGEYVVGLNGNGLPNGFNNDLLAIPAGVAPELIINSEHGKRANLYKWADKAVIEISGVNTSGSLKQDIIDCVNDFLGRRLSETGTAVIAKLNQLHSQGYAKSNILIRGHSLGSLDAFRILEMDLAGNGILLGVPLHAVIHLKRHFHLPADQWPENPFPSSKVAFFVSPTDPVARGLPTPNYLGYYKDVWCRVQKGPAPLFNKPPPSNIKFNVVQTAGDDFLTGHFITSYCPVAPVTCFRQ